ncbi:hypothetical protein C9374_011058 [Naegleria lovaniensis]|uniref:Uncharacterized protein n=1 Tax=Naegleria lovaniensis TaxID=51637 RepID=A0AA88GHH9_NAELO|nr:uncharacterized protein C9374_011058 [Naegleria lovaniensis]KAG2374221.1 hypothetical protein C9374_011058 [Naegleria lovaniensis]
MSESHSHRTSDLSNIEHAYFELNKALHLKIKQLEQYELCLQERERELNRRELLLIEKYGSDKWLESNSQTTQPRDHLENDVKTTHEKSLSHQKLVDANVFTVTQFDINFTSNKMKTFNSNRGVIKHHVDDQLCACMGLIEENSYDNFDVIRFQVKLGNNCEGLYLGFASQDDFYLSGKNYLTCAWMIQIMLRDEKIHLVKFSPQQEFEGGEEITLRTPEALNRVQTLFGLKLEMNYHVKKGIIELSVHDGESMIIFDGLLEHTRIRLFPAFETRQTNCQFEFDSSDHDLRE